MSEYLEDLEPKESAHELHIASSWTRLLNYILDNMAIGLIISFFFKQEPKDVKDIEALLAALGDPKMILINAAFTIGYYFIFEALTGQTLGKIITRTKVVDDYGNKPGFLRILGRSLCRMIPFEPISFLFGPIGWHDSITKTVVVKKEIPLIQSKE